MLDRVPTKPNRYAVYDDAHNFLRYEYHERADEPTQVGTPLNKANLLSDTTAAAIKNFAGLSANPTTVDGALSAFSGVVGVKIETGSYVGTGVYGSSNPTQITFGFPPKMVVVFEEEHGLMPGEMPYWAGSLLWVAGQTKYSLKGYSASGDSELSRPIAVSGNTLSWYGMLGASGQLNASGIAYRYFAIG